MIKNKYCYNTNKLTWLINNKTKHINQQLLADNYLSVDYPLSQSPLGQTVSGNVLTDTQKWIGGSGGGGCICD